MSYLLNRSICAFRGPLGQHIPRTLFANPTGISAGSANLSALTPNQNRQPLFSEKYNNGLQLARRVMSSNHVALWTGEKVLSAALVPIIPLAFAMPSATMDYLLAITMAVHSHWGIEAIVVDYVRPSIFGEIIPKIGVALVYGLTTLTLGGLFYFIYTDVGIVNAIKMLWKL